MNYQKQIFIGVGDIHPDGQIIDNLSQQKWRKIPSVEPPLTSLCVVHMLIYTVDCDTYLLQKKDYLHLQNLNFKFLN